jgi:hypothetical protein
VLDEQPLRRLALGEPQPDVERPSQRIRSTPVPASASTTPSRRRWYVAARVATLQAVEDEVAVGEVVDDRGPGLLREANGQRPAVVTVRARRGRPSGAARNRLRSPPQGRDLDSARRLPDLHFEVDEVVCEATSSPAVRR